MLHEFLREASACHSEESRLGVLGKCAEEVAASPGKIWHPFRGLNPEGPWHPHVECRGAPQPDPITEGLFEGSPPTFRGGCRDKAYMGRAKLSARLSKAHDRGVAFGIGSPETVRSGRRDGVQLG